MKHTGATHSIGNIIQLEKCSQKNVARKNCVAVHNGSNYDYHFIIKDLSEESEKRLNYLVKNTENYITFTIPTEKKVTRIDKNEEEITNKYI